MKDVYLALGSNLGDRKANLEKAVKLLAETLCISKVSSWHETEPVGGPVGQGSFLNGALQAETGLSPESLLELCQRTENDLGRNRNVERWGPRCIDIDIIFYEDMVIDDPRINLTVPHPMVCQRRFVLEPLCEIAPEKKHPLNGKTVKELLKDLDRQ